MSPVYNSSLKSKDSTEPFLTDHKNSFQKLSNEFEHSPQWISQRRTFIHLLNHINRYDKDLYLSSKGKFFVTDSDDRINYLRSKIKNSPELYMISDMEKGTFNRERIVNLQTLFSKRQNLRSSGNTARYEGVKVAITTACWEQMREDLEIAESIPQIRDTWLAPILVLLAKFPYYESSTLKIVKAHFRAISWPFSDTVSITKQINPLRRNVLNDSIIPRDNKLKDFYWIMNQRTFIGGYHSKKCTEGLKLLYQNLTNEIFIDDDKWSSHVENFSLISRQQLPSPGTGLALF